MSSNPKYRPTQLRAAWEGMRARCSNPNIKNFNDYGGRGIRVCERWENSFASFAEDMGEPPSTKHSLDRRNNDLGYSKDNCRWATRVEQGRNKRNNKMLTHAGITQCQSAWSEATGLPKGCIIWRLKSGWPVDKALTLPRGTPLEAKRTNPRDTRVEVTCEYCSTPFRVRIAHRNRGWGRFCSKSCAKHIPNHTPADHQEGEKRP